jgi:hypothetical protein
MLVYRDERTTRSAGAALEELRGEISGAGTGEAAQERVLAAFLRAGELECAVADAGKNARVAQSLTDELASAWVGPQRRDGAWRLRVQGLLRTLQPPSVVCSKTPEGYAYYGLTPDAYATLARAHAPATDVTVVIGLRSIGTTLSAIVCSVLRARGQRCVRFTVRPGGHPWDRALRLNHDQRAVVRLGLESNADFIVVDEGPGMSGSTLLAAAEAILNEGVPRDRLSVYTSHAPDPAKLLAPRARERWQRLRVQSASSGARPAAADLQELSGGAWRSLFATPDAFPGCWIEQERLKFLHAPSSELYKFAGLPPYGRRAQQQADALWHGGFGAAPLRYQQGFLVSRWVPGTPLTRRALSAELIDHIARYCAFRRRHFAADHADCDALTTMTRVNVSEALRADLPAQFQLVVEAAVYADGRMLPHEWIAPDDAGKSPVKVDALDHGDGHLYPGPTDIRWDLAGAISEWEMDDRQRRLFTERYGVHARERTNAAFEATLDDYLLAYAAFRAGYLTFALHGAADAERDRLERARTRCEEQLAIALRRRGGEVPERHMGHAGAGATPAR